MMTKTLKLLLISILFFSCEEDSSTNIKKDTFKVEKKEDKEVVLTNFEIENYVNRVDSLFNNGLLEERKYPNRSRGALTGHFKGDDLVYYEGMKAGEFGFVLHKGYLSKSKFYKLITKNYLETENGVPEPDENGYINRDKIVFDDEVTTLFFTKTKQMLIVLNGDEISHHIDTWNQIQEQEISSANEIVIELNSITK
jgi:hypothetical protein